MENELIRVTQFLWSSGVGAAALLGLPRHAAAADTTGADCLNANNSSVDLQNANKLRAAHAQLIVCAADRCPADVQKECLRRVDEVSARIPTIIFETKDASGNDLRAVKVTIDGQPLADRLEGTALPIDPGEHSFVFETAGRPPLTKRLVVREAERERRERIEFGIVEPPCPPGDERSPGGPCAAAPPSTELGAQQIVAIIDGGIGLVGMGMGSVFGLMAMSKRDDASKFCPHDCSDQSDVSRWSDAKTIAQFSDIAFVVGGAGLVGGAVLWFTAKRQSASRASAQVAFGPWSVHVNGAW